MELTDGCYSEGIPRSYQSLFTPVSLGYPLSVFNKNSTLKANNDFAYGRVQEPYRGRARFVQKLTFYMVSRPKLMFFMQNFNKHTEISNLKKIEPIELPAKLQQIADRVAQNLEIIPKKLSI